MNVLNKITIKSRMILSFALEMFAGWKPIRVEVEELVLKGDRNAAGRITRGKGADYVSRLERKIYMPSLCFTRKNFMVYLKSPPSKAWTTLKRNSWIRHLKHLPYPCTRHFKVIG